MKTIYVVQNGDDEPVMAFMDERSAVYVAKTNDSVYSTVFAVTLIEHDCATDQMMGELNHE